MGIYEDCWKMIANCNNIASEYDKGIKALEVESSRYRNPRPIKYLLLPHFYSVAIKITFVVLFLFVY